MLAVGAADGVPGLSLRIGALTCRATQLHAAPRHCGHRPNSLRRLRIPRSSAWNSRRGYVRDAAANRCRRLQTIGRTPHAERAAIQDVRIDHRRADIGVAEKLLNGSDVVPVLEEVSRE
jgi:hypothetical protein